MESINLINTLFVSCGILSCVSSLALIMLYRRNKQLSSLLNNINKLESKIKKLESPMKIDDVVKYLNVFDNLLLSKFNYYIHVHFLANFEKRKEISKETIRGIKEEYYIDVSSTLKSEQKYKLLEIFSNKGIEMYIHQFFLQKLNELDVKYRKIDDTLKDSAPDPSLLKEIYKG